MSDDLVTRLRKIASDILGREQVDVTSAGEDYYVFAALSPEGVTSRFPPVWIAPEASDRQIREKLSVEFLRDLNPDSAPDDLSVPNLRTEGRQR